LVATIADRAEKRLKQSSLVLDCASEPARSCAGRRPSSGDVPELALPAGLIDQPWTATSIELKAAGIQLGETCPKPIIAHRNGRKRALKTHATVPAK
jgi:FAD binding domain of DNA photolyase